MNSIDIANETLISENLIHVYVVKYLMICTNYHNLVLFLEHRIVVGHFNSIFIKNFVFIYQWVIEGSLVAGSHQVGVDIFQLGVADVFAVGLE